MRNLVIAIVCFVIAVLCVVGMSWGAVYYVDCNADGDAGAGTSTAANVAWKTIAKVNASSFSGDDQILFKRGCTWREQLTVPSSGTSGHPITFGAYGSGEKPIISGADVITPGTSWAAYSGDWTTTYSYGGAWTQSTVAAKTHARDIVAAADISTSGNTIRITLKGHSTTAYDILGCSIVERSGTSDDGTTTPTRITFDSGSSSTTVQIGTDKVSDEITFALDETKTYLLHIFFNTGVTTYAATSGGRYYKTSDTNYTMDQTWSSDGNSSNFFFLSKIEVKTPTANVWQATVTTEPNIVLFNGTVGTKVASIGDITGANKWYWAANVLYVYSTSDPDTAYTNPGIEPGARDDAVYMRNKSYITFNGLTLTGGNGASGLGNGIRIFASEGENNDNITVTNCTLQSNHNCGLYSNRSTTGTNTNFTITNNTVRYNGGAGLRPQDVVSGTNVLTGNTAYENGKYYINADPDFDYNAGILVANGSGWTISQNSSYNNGIDTGVEDLAGIGIWVDGCPSNDCGGTVISRNLVYNNQRVGIAILGNTARGVSNASAYYNVVYNHIRGTYPRGIWTGLESDGISIYNNSVSGNTYGIYVTGTSAGDTDVTNTLVKNNISSGNVTSELYANNLGAGNVFDYNCFGAEGSNFIYYAGSNYSTYDDWETAYGGTTHSVEADPLFINAATSDFRLRHASPAKDTGTDVSLTTDYQGRTVPKGSAPDIGAYEYPSMGQGGGGSLNLLGVGK